DEAVLCDRIGLLLGGKLLSIDTPKNISQRYPHKLYRVKASKMSAVIRILKAVPGVISCYGFGEYAHIAVDRLDAETEAHIRSRLLSEGLGEIEMGPTVPTIE